MGVGEVSMRGKHLFGSSNQTGNRILDPTVHANPLQDANVVGTRPTTLLREAERTCSGESKSITNIYSQNFVATPAHVESREVSEPDHMNHSESGGEREDGETKHLPWRKF